jgi:hypothetical protein
MDERPDRPIHVLEQVRQAQDDQVAQFDPTNVQVDVAKLKLIQKSREHTARSVLNDAYKCNNFPSEAVNIYVSKTKARLDEVMTPRQGGFHCALTYHSVLRTLDSSAMAGSKKEAKNQAALLLLEKFRG